MALHRLPLELQVLVASYLDLSSTLALASSSPSLLPLATSPLEWARLLARIPWTSGEPGLGPSLQVLAHLTTFLRDLPSSSHHHLALLHNICSSFPPTKDKVSDRVDTITVRCEKGHLHLLSTTGFLLLHAAMEERPVSWRLVGVELFWFMRPLLAALVTWVGRQEEKEARVDLTSLTFSTREDVEGWLVVLGKCKEWKVATLFLFGGLEEGGWRRLMGVLNRGSLDLVITELGVMAEGRREEVEELWRSTRDWWGGGERDVVREGREEEGWQELQDMMEDFEGGDKVLVYK